MFDENYRGDKLYEQGYSDAVKSLNEYWGAGFKAGYLARCVPFTKFLGKLFFWIKLRYFLTDKQRYSLLYRNVRQNQRASK